MIRSNQKMISLLLILMDAAVCVLAMPLAYGLRFWGWDSQGGLPLEVSLWMLVPVVPLFLLL